MSILGQAELGWQEQPRNAHGEWTRFPAEAQAVSIIRHAHGGFTVSPRTGQRPRSGFMVAETGHTRSYPASILDNPDQLARAVHEILGPSMGRDAYVGGWVHEGRLWLEPSDDIASLEEAVRAGRSRDQIAIWDVAGHREIPTGGSGAGSTVQYANGILDQIDLAPAWLHEARDAHGRWARGTAANPAASVSIPRVSHGYQGRFSGRDTFIPSMKPAQGTKALTSRGRPDGTGTADDPIDVQGNIDRAILLMAQGKHVRLNQVDEVATLLVKVNQLAQDYQRHGRKMPAWDMGKISVAGTNLFTTQTKGIPRIKMPQLNGPAQPGTRAAALAGGAGNFIELDRQFRDQLARDGVSVTDQFVPTAHLRATQRELTASTVAGIAQAYLAGNPKVRAMMREPIWVSRDNYVIDGHHRWAAQMVLDALDGRLGNDTVTQVHRVDMDIGAVVPYANQFAQDWGIQARPLGNAHLVDSATPLLDQAGIELSWKDAWRHELRDAHGRWARTPGAGMIDLYHHTTPENAAEIRRTGRFTSPERDGHGRPVAFFTTERGTGSQAGGRGSGLVHIRVPEDMATLEDEFPSGEKHYSVPVSQIRPEHIATEAQGEAGSPADAQLDQDLARVRNDLDTLMNSGKITAGAVFNAIGSASAALGKGDPEQARQWLATASKMERNIAGPDSDGHIKLFRESARQILAAQGRAEARGPHEPQPEAYPGQFSDRIIRFWKDENNPDAKQALNLAGASYDASDYAATAKYLRRAAKTSSDLVDSKRYEDLATDIEAKGEKDNGDKKAMTELAARAAQIVPGLLSRGRPAGHLNAFNGKVEVVPSGSLETGYTLAQMDWDGTMKIRQDVAEEIRQDMEHPDEPIKDPTQHVVILHEEIHGDVPPGTQGVNRDAYQDYATARIEEGATELGAIQHAPEYFEKLGIAGRKIAGIMSVSGAGDPVDNPDYAALRDKLHAQLRDEAARLRSDEGPHPSWDDVARRVDQAADAVDQGDLDYADERLDRLKFLGDKTGSAHYYQLIKEIDRLRDTPQSAQATMGEYARRIQDPVRIGSRDGTQIWGHYPDQVADMQDWVQQVAMEEGNGDLRPGTPGWDRVVQLTDQINQQGAAGKIGVMARQLEFATVKDPALRNDPEFMGNLLDSIQENIRDEWGKAGDTSRAKAAFRGAKRYVGSQVHERLMQEGLMAQAGAAT